MVTSSYAVVNPWTVVVMSLHTPVTDTTVMRSRGSVYLACVADFEKSGGWVFPFGRYRRQGGGLEEETRV